VSEVCQRYTPFFSIEKHRNIDFLYNRLDSRHLTPFQNIAFLKKIYGYVLKKKRLYKIYTFSILLFFAKSLIIRQLNPLGYVSMFFLTYDLFFSQGVGQAVKPLIISVSEKTIFQKCHNSKLSVIPIGIFYIQKNS